MANGGAPAQPEVVPGVPTPDQPAAGLPGPYGAKQGYGAGVMNGPTGAPIATHPEDFIAHGDAPAQNQPVPLPAPGGNGDKPVTLDIFYETKCPFSLQFIDGEVKPALSDPTCVFQHVHINWEPYGNAQDSGDAVSCQHGEDECFGNKLHLCAKKEFGADNDGLTAWVTCVMTNLVPDGKMSHDEDTFRGCDDGKADALLACANSDDSLNMLKTAGAETQGGQIQQAPWVVLEATPGYNLQGALVNSICGQMAEQSLEQPQCCAAAAATQRRLLV